MIEPRKPDWNDVLFYAFRYSLGRSTTAPSDMVAYLKYQWEQMPEAYKNMIKKEIEVAIKCGRAGMAMDVKCWREILDL